MPFSLWNVLEPQNVHFFKTANASTNQKAKAYINYLHVLPRNKKREPTYEANNCKNAQVSLQKNAQFESCSNKVWGRVKSSHRTNVL